MSEPSDPKVPAPVDKRAFDARFRWIVLPEMRRLQQRGGLSTIDEVDRVYGILRDRTIIVLQAASEEPLLAAAIRIKLAARQFVTAILLDAGSQPPPPEPGSPEPQEPLSTE
jgi:hypothetical protein